MSNQEMIKRVSDVAPALGIIAAIISVAIAFYAGQAIAAHDESSESHAKLKSDLQNTHSNLDLFQLKLEQNSEIFELVQTQNKADHERIFTALTRISDKLDEL